VKFRGNIRIPRKRANSAAWFKIPWPAKNWALLLTVCLHHCYLPFRYCLLLVHASYSALVGRLHDCCVFLLQCDGFYLKSECHVPYRQQLCNDFVISSLVRWDSAYIQYEIIFVVQRAMVHVHSSRLFVCLICV